MGRRTGVREGGGMKTAIHSAKIGAYTAVYLRFPTSFKILLIP